MSADHLFVYGTLLRSASHPMHALLQPATFAGRGEFQGKLYDLGNYPGVIASNDPADIVRGEVYRLHDPGTTLVALDRYEGCDETASAPTEYVRAVASVRLAGGGSSIQAWLYLYQWPLAGVRRIESGDYLS